MGGSQKKQQKAQNTLVTGDDLKTVKEALTRALSLTDPTKNRDCDEALKKQYGIPSLNALVKG